VELQLVTPGPPIPFRHLVIGAAVSLLAAFALLVVWRSRDVVRKQRRKAVNYLRGKVVKTKLIRFSKARPSGQMVFRNAPSKEGRTAFDLARISRDSNKVTIGIGSDPSNPIVLPYPSVGPSHCVIWAGRERFPSRVYIEPRSQGHLAVNGERVTRTRQLEDGDVIEIGECRFEFHDTQFHSQVEVHLHDGRVYDGMLENWDLNQSMFYLTPRGSAKGEFITLRFENTAYVHFHRDQSDRRKDTSSSSPGWRLRRAKIVAITLTNRETLKGFMHKKYSPFERTSGIFLLPLPGEPRIHHTYIPSTSIKTVITTDRK